MKYFKLSLVTLAILISGCGGGNSSSSTPNTPTTSGSGNINETKTVAEAEKNLNLFSSFAMEDLSLDSVTGNNSKALQKVITNKISNQKSTTVNCSDGGTLTVTPADDQKSFSYSYNQCKEGSSLIDGEISMVLQANSPDMKLTYKELTIIDEEGRRYMNLTINLNKDSSRQIDTITLNGIVNQRSKSGEKNNIAFTNFIIKEKETVNESWTTLNGMVAIESKCTTGTYRLETIEKLVDATDGSDHTESGILKINGATYTFENPYVTIKAGTQEETIKQSELEKRIANACAI